MAATEYMLLVFTLVSDLAFSVNTPHPTTINNNVCEVFISF